MRFSISAAALAGCLCVSGGWLRAFLRALMHLITRPWVVHGTLGHSMLQQWMILVTLGLQCNGCYLSPNKNILLELNADETAGVCTVCTM